MGATVSCELHKIALTTSYAKCIILLMQSFRDVITAMGGPSGTADKIGGNVNTVTSWHYRDSIPSKHWVRVVLAAERFGVAGISLEGLGRIAAGEHGRSDAA